MGGLGATGGSGLPRPAGLRIGAGRLPAVERGRRVAVHRPARGAFVWLPAEEQGRRVAAVVVRTCFVAPGNGRTRG